MEKAVSLRHPLCNLYLTIVLDYHYYAQLEGKERHLESSIRRESVHLALHFSEAFSNFLSISSYICDVLISVS
jgi:hypothetical protein